MKALLSDSRLSAPLPRFRGMARELAVLRPAPALALEGRVTRCIAAARGAVARSMDALGGSRWLLLPIAALLAVYAIFYVVFAAQLIQFPYDLDQGEGYDAWSAWLIDRGQLPYSNNLSYPYYSSNYPPLWSWLVSIPMAWTGPGLAPARAVSALASVLAAGVIGLAARRRTGSVLAGGLAAGLFLASPYVFHTTPLARVNGTTLLFAVIGVSLFEVPTRARYGLGGLALLAALFTKPTAIDAVAAALLFALGSRPRLGIPVAAALLALGSLLGGLLALASRGAFMLNVVAGNANPFDLQQLSAYLGNFTQVHAFVLLLAAAELAVSVRRHQWSPWLLYLPLSLAMALGAGKWGAGESYFLAPIAAASVLAATFVARLVRSAGRRRTALVAAALLVQMALFAHGPLSTAFPALPDRGFQGGLLGVAPGPADRAAADQIAAVLRKAQGPVLVEDPSFAVAAGKPVVANATHLRNLYQAGLWDPASMVADLQARRYDVVVLNANLYPEPVLAAIGRWYYQARTYEVNGFRYAIFFPGSA